MYRPMMIPPRPIQYADDTNIVTEAHPATLRVLVRVLQVYGKLMGLQINRHKSRLVPLAIPNHLVNTIQSILGCERAHLSITYLGLLLLVRLTKVDFQPLVNSVRNRMASWTSSILSYGGRTTLVKSVLTTLPLHYMQTIKIPKGVLKHIDRARRSFLWKRNDTCNGINCLVNWPIVCALKKNGGLRILSLETQNDALLSKWLWKLDRDSNGLWAQTMSLLYGIIGRQQLHDNPNYSIFVRSIYTVLSFYRMLLVPDDFFSIVHWKWTSHGNFTTSSAYEVLHDRGL